MVVSFRKDVQVFCKLSMDVRKVVQEDSAPEVTSEVNVMRATKTADIVLV
jgi:hypothetical protein